jgi:hypothetical protein
MSQIRTVERRENPIGYRLVDGVEEPVNADFWVLLADDEPGRVRQVGYLLKDRNVINFTRRFSEDDQAAIKRLVKQTFDIDVEQTAQPCAIPEPEDDEDDEEDSQDES